MSEPLAIADPGILDLIHDSVFRRDLEGRVLDWNRASEELYGWAKAQVVGRRAHELLESRHARALADLEAHLMVSGIWEGELTRTTSEGREIAVDVRWCLRRDAAGNPADIIETARDITVRKTLETSEQRYRHLFHYMPIALFQVNAHALVDLFKGLRAAGVTELSGHLDAHPGFLGRAIETLVVEEVNERAVQLFGAREPRELLGPSTQYWQERPQTIRRALEARFRGERTFQEETRLNTPDGRVIDVLFAAARPGEQLDSTVSLVGVIDITERKRAQETLQRVQADLAHAARVAMLGELTASIAHEVNQPLAAIATNGEAGLLWLGRSPPNVAEARELTKRIVADAQRAADIIKGLRALAVGRAPEQTAVCLHAVIEETMLFLRHEIDARGVAVALDFAPAIPRVLADRTQLQQVIVNLAVNALHALAQLNGERRTLTVRTALSSAAVLDCAIEDNGPGLRPEHLERLFDRFFTTKADGMGMGLPICKSIIEAHGGEIRIANRAAGRGVCASFTLPAYVPKG